MQYQAILEGEHPFATTLLHSTGNIWWVSRNSVVYIGVSNLIPYLYSDRYSAGTFWKPEVVGKIILQLAAYE